MPDPSAIEWNHNELPSEGCDYCRRCEGLGVVPDVPFKTVKPCDGCEGGLVPAGQGGQFTKPGFDGVHRRHW